MELNLDLDSEPSALEAINSLIGELEYISSLLDDGNLEEAVDELQCQAGTIQSIIGELTK